MLALGRHELIELNVGDLVLWVGKQTEYTFLNRRTLYQVVERREPEKPERIVQYRFRAVYDIENPIGTAVDATPFISSRDTKRIDLLDLGVLRLTFDTFIKEWARSRGVEVGE